MDDHELMDRIRRTRHNYSRNADLMTICDALEGKILDVKFMIEEIELYDPDYFANARKRYEIAEQ